MSAHKCALIFLEQNLLLQNITHVTFVCHAVQIKRDMQFLKHIMQSKSNFETCVLEVET